METSIVMPALGMSRFRGAVFFLVAVYALLQILYIARLPLVMDEFDGAYEAYRLRHSVPYRDFVPYKTVIGYYIEALPTFVSGVWNRIIAIKTEILLINGAVLAWAALYMRKFFRPPAILLSLLLLICCSNFLERSSELRVDMFTAWAGLASLLLLMNRRYPAAGFLCAASFLISQKGAFYVIAANIALLACRELRKAIAFNIAFAIPVAFYVAIWSAISSPEQVWRATFVSAAGAGMLNAYAIWGQFWSQTVLRDPLFFLLAPFAVIYLARRNLLIAVYSAAVIAQSLLYSQPWPYFFVLLIPTLFVLYAAFFDALELRPVAIAVITIVGVVYPLTRIAAVMARDNSYQHYNVDVASFVLGPRDTYLAGNDVIHDREQALTPLARLDAVTIATLHQLTEAELDQIAQAIEQRTPKLIITTNRIRALPKRLLGRIDRQYAQLTGSIYSYAPRFEAGMGRMGIVFGGRYRIEGNAEINGIARKNGDDIVLSPGVVAVNAAAPGRLHFLPVGVERILDPRFVEEQQFYPDVYGY